MAEKRLTHAEMVDAGVQTIIRAFGKGEDLHGAVWQIVTGVSIWTERNLEEAEKKKGKRR